MFHAKESFGISLIDSERNSKRWRTSLRRLPTREEVINLLVGLEDICKFHSDENRSLEVDYGVIKSLRKTVDRSESLLNELLSPSIFLQLPSVAGKVAVTTLLALITRSITERGLYASLAVHSVGDTSSEEITSIDALEDWLFQQSQRLFQIRKMTEQFLPLWVFTAAHTIAFFHGHSRATKISTMVPGSSRVSTTGLRMKIKEFVTSTTMKSLQELSRPVVEDMESNPFSRLRAVRYYDSFTVFDANRNVQASAFEQCCIFGGGYMNPVFMERLLALNGGQSLDYRRFLNFAIAWDNRKTVQAARFFWSVVDKSRRGYMTKQDLQELVAGILLLLQFMPSACGPQGPRASLILCDEIKDLCRTHSIGLASDRDQECVITRDEALENPELFGAIIGVLGNTQTFIEYECREDTAHKFFVSKQMKDARMARLKSVQGTRSGQLSTLQQLVDDCWFFQDGSTKSPLSRFGSFAEFLDYHETEFGGESMEPWLARYYQWEQQEADNLQMHLSCEGDSVSVIHQEEFSVAEPSELVEARE
jgi:hypothetical protein